MFYVLSTRISPIIIRLDQRTEDGQTGTKKTLLMIPKQILNANLELLGVRAIPWEFHFQWK